MNEQNNENEVKKSIAKEIAIVVLIFALAVTGLILLSSKMQVSPNGNNEMPLEIVE